MVFPHLQTVHRQLQGAVLGQSHRLHIAVQVNGLTQLDAHNAVVSGPGIIVGMISLFASLIFYDLYSLKYIFLMEACQTLTAIAFPAYYIWFGFIVNSKIKKQISSYIQYVTFFRKKLNCSNESCKKPCCFSVNVKYKSKFQLI